MITLDDNTAFILALTVFCLTCMVIVYNVRLLRTAELNTPPQLPPGMWYTRTEWTEMPETPEERAEWMARIEREFPIDFEEAWKRAQK